MKIIYYYLNYSLFIIKIIIPLLVLSPSGRLPTPFIGESFGKFGGNVKQETGKTDGTYPETKFG